MAKGILGIIGCPMLEDELIHSIYMDSEDKRVIVLRTGHENSLVHKMTSKGMEFETYDEMDFSNGWIDIDGGVFNIVISMNNLGLHAEPKKLMAFIQDQLVMLKGRVDAVGLYYGMCGNNGWDITQWSQDNLPFRVAVFRDCNGRVCDDCVGVAVGGLDGYKRLLKEHTGQLLLTPAMAMNWMDFLMAGDMGKGLRLMPPSGDPQKDMKDLLKMCGYTTAAQIDTGLADRAEFDVAVKELVEYLEFDLVQAASDIVDRGPMDRMYAECKGYLEN